MGNRFREKVVEEGLTGEQESTVQTHNTAAPQQMAAGQDPFFAHDEVMERPMREEGGKAAKRVAKVLGGDVLADKMVLRQIPLLLLCLLFLLLLVANRYRVESLSREKMATEERINDLREHRIQMLKHYQENVKISHIADDLKETGVGITNGPPYEIEK